MFAQPTLVVNKDVDVFQVIGLMKTYTVCVRECVHVGRQWFHTEALYLQQDDTRNNELSIRIFEPLVC